MKFKAIIFLTSLILTLSNAYGSQSDQYEEYAKKFEELAKSQGFSQNSQDSTNLNWGIVTSTGQNDTTDDSQTSFYDLLNLQKQTTNSPTGKKDGQANDYNEIPPASSTKSTDSTTGTKNTNTSNVTNSTPNALKSANIISTDNSTATKQTPDTTMPKFVNVPKANLPKHKPKIAKKAPKKTPKAKPKIKPKIAKKTQPKPKVTQAKSKAPTTKQVTKRR